MQIEVGHIIIEAIAIAISSFLTMWAWRRSDRKEREEIRSSAKQEQQRQFDSLKQGQAALQTKMETCPLHAHTEKDGPLHVEGIWPRME